MPGDRLRASIVDPNDCTLFLEVNADGSINVTTVAGAMAITPDTDTALSILAADQVVLAANVNRVGFELLNYGDTNIHLQFSGAAATTADAAIYPNAGYNQPMGSGFVYQGEIRAISDGAPSTVPNLSVLEWS